MESSRLAGSIRMRRMLIVLQSVKGPVFCYRTEGPGDRGMGVR